MKLVDGFIARKRAERLRSAREMSEIDLRRLQDELVARGVSAIEPVSECLSHGDARGPALEVLDRLVSDATLDDFLDLLASANSTVVSGISRVLCSSRKFTPRRLLTRIRTAPLPRLAFEPVLREHVASLPIPEIASMLPGLPREGQLLLLSVLDRSQDPSFGLMLAPLLKHEDPWLRAGIARLFGNHPGSGVVAGLSELLADPAKAVRLEAVSALHALLAHDAVPALIDALEDSDIKVQSAAIDALRAMADVTAVPSLVTVLTNESEYVRRAAVEVLNVVATAEAIQDLVRALRDEDWWVRVRAADALGTLGGEKVVAAVIGLMKDEDDFIRRHAIEILNAVPDPTAVPALIAALEDTDWWVRERAIDALGKTRDERALEPLVGLLGRDNATDILCARGLGALGLPGSLRPLLGLLESAAEEVRLEATRALQEFPRGNLSSADRSLLHDALSLANVGSGHSMEIPMRVRGGVSTGSSILMHPVLGSPGGGELAPPQRRFGQDRGTNAPAERRQMSLVPTARDAAPPSSAIRRDPTGALGINFSDLPEGHEFLDRYRILRKIGRGGFGTVYLAEDRFIQEEIILKVLNPQLSLDEGAARRFVQELKLARRVSHRNVIRIHDFLDLGGARAISMEYFPGKDLGNLLAEHHLLEPGRALHIASQVADGLACAHAEGVIHRDIKPANILVGADDDTRLVDFGLASVHQNLGDGSRLTKSGLLIGTPEYMAPEQISGEKVDHRADVYALGIVLYEALSGLRPYTAESPVKILFQHLEGGAKPLSEVMPTLPAAVANLVSRAMARDPNDRPPTAAEFHREIEELLPNLKESS
jgi:eukaryotic-like serine/threonine-protein kinase